MNQNLGQPVKNKHKVPQRAWGRWDNSARRVFNKMMYSMRPRAQTIMVHPGATIMPKEHWEAIRWNASWLAADAANTRKQK